MKLIEQTFKEFADKDAVNTFLDTINTYNYCIIGGLAVSLYSKSIRKVSPDDLDVYLDESEIELFLHDLTSKGFHVVRSHNFDGTQWYVVSTGSVQEFDVALKPSTSKYFDTAESFNYKGLNLKVLSKKYLVLNKLLAKRDKDLRDLLYMLKDEPDSFIKMIRKRVSGEERDLLDQLVQDLDNFEMMVNVYGSGL